MAVLKPSQVRAAGAPRSTSEQPTLRVDTRRHREGWFPRGSTASKGKALPEIQRAQRKQEAETGFHLLSPKSPPTKQASASTAPSGFYNPEGNFRPVLRTRQGHPNDRGDSHMPSTLSTLEDNAINNQHAAIKGSVRNKPRSNRLQPQADVREKQMFPEVGGGGPKTANGGQGATLEQKIRLRGSTAENNTESHGELLPGAGGTTAPWGNVNPRDQREKLSGGKRLWSQRQPTDSAYTRWNPGPDTVKIEGARGNEGRETKGSGAPRKPFGIASQPATVDGTFRTNRQKVTAGDGISGSALVGVIEKGVDKRGLSTLREDDDRFSRERPGDRYYLPSPRQHLPCPRSPPHDSNSPRRNSRRHNLRRASEPSAAERERGLAFSMHGGGNVDASSVQSRRGRKASFPSGRLHGEQAEDTRPMLGPLATPQWNYGWRVPSSTTSTVFRDEDYSPYYVDRKQVRSWELRCI